jgi:hypothetical protein
MTDAHRPPPPDVVTTEGFPKGWSMVHRSDTTLLVRQAEPGMLFATTLCAAPKLLQGNAWLETARLIAWAVSAEVRRDTDTIFAAFCDRCGMGPSCDAHGDTNPNVRALRTWTCHDCDHVNVRPTSASGANT